METNYFEPTCNLSTYAMLYSLFSAQESHDALMESMEDHGFLLTDLDYADEKGWTSYSTDNLWTFHDLPANTHNFQPAGPMADCINTTQSQFQHVFTRSYNSFERNHVYASLPLQGNLHGDSQKHVYSSEEIYILEEDEGLAKSNNSNRYSDNGTLLSEKRRRCRLNQMLYVLRSLVPKITKMDKASIVGDAISYVQELQKELNDIQAEIQELESEITHKDSEFFEEISVLTHDDIEIPLDNNRVCQSSQVNRSGQKITLQLDVFKVEEMTFHIQIHCKKGPEVLTKLTRALESLHLDFQNANLTSFNGHIIKTVTIKTKACEETMKKKRLKEIILEAVSNYGFQCVTEVEK